MSLDVGDLLGINADEVRSLRELTGCSIFEAKAKLVKQKLNELLEQVEDPTVKTILSVLITQYR